MPQYIKQAPWYVSQGKDLPVLTHQRARTDPSAKPPPLEHFIRRGTDTTQVTKFRKGACTNCGAMSHTAKTCTDRPRRVGAKYSQRDFGRDEFIEEVGNMGYEGKRDRWNGYDPSSYKFVIEEWDNLHDVQKQRKAQQVEEQMRKKAEDGQQKDSSSEEENDSDKEKGEED